MLFLTSNAPLHCQRGVYQATSYCSQIPQAPKGKLPGVKTQNGANSSAAMRFSAYVQNYSPSASVQVCTNGRRLNWAYVEPHTALNSNCYNPIFSKTWTSKINIPKCGCSSPKNIFF